MLVSVVHTKGGVGKSTTAIYSATAATRLGLRAKILDTDPQGTATAWSCDATANGHPLPFPVGPASIKDLQRVARADFTIIDTPPGNARVIDAAIDAADLVVVPTQPSPADVRRVWPTMRAAAHRPTVVLLTRVHLNRLLLPVVRNALESEQVTVLDSVVLDREHIRQSWAETPMRLGGYDDVLNEIRTLKIGENADAQ